MLYITQERRTGIISGEKYPETSGELNYNISSICHDYINTKGLSYSTLNEVIGVLECAKMELYRILAVPYEDQKKKENGSVSNLDK